MKVNKKVIIIGSGIGGLYCGIKLLHAGFEVEIFEKESKVGGVAATKIIPPLNIHFDECASIVIEPNEYKKIFYDIQLNPDDFFTFMPLQNLYKVFFYNNETFLLSRNLYHQKENFEQMFHEPFCHYVKFVKQLNRVYTIATQEFLTKPFIRFKKLSFVSPRMLKKIYVLKPFQSASFLIRHYIKNKEFQKVLLFQCLYMGISPYKLMATYSIIPAVAQSKGIYHIKGGMGAYIEGLKQVFEQLGGSIHLNSNVESITMADHKATGVIVNSKKIPSEYVISNADYCYTISKLLKKQRGLKKIRRNCKAYHHTCSVFILRLCLNKKFETFSVHNIYINEEFKKEINYIFKGQLPKSPPLYIYYPSSIDDNFASKGYSCMNIMIRVPNLSYKNIRWDKKTIALLRFICLNTLEKITQCHQIEKSIVYEECLTPTSLKNKYNLTKGAAFGIAPTRFQNMMFRPQHSIPSIKNLYFVGSSIHPGNGVSIVMKNATQVVHSIIKNKQPN